LNQIKLNSVKVTDTQIKLSIVFPNKRVENGEIYLNPGK